MKTRHDLKNQNVERLPFVSAFSEEEKQEAIKKLVISKGTYRFQDAVKLKDLQIDTTILSDSEGNTLNLHLIGKKGEFFTIPYHVFSKHDVFEFTYIPQSWNMVVGPNIEIEYFTYSCTDGNMIINLKSKDHSV